MLHTNVVEKIKINMSRSINRTVYYNVMAKYGKAGQATDGNMAHAFGMPDT
jgi:hypothetical protein